MAVARYGFQMARGVPVVTAPAEIDAVTAGQLRAVLLECRARGYAAVVVDMTGTQFCDSAGLTELVRAHQRARVEGGGLRLVIAGHGVVPRVLAITGVDRLIPCFAHREQALVPAAAIRAARYREHLGDPTDAGSQ